MKTAAVLVTGGAGYIGSHAVLACQEAGYDVAVLDNLSTGLRGLVPADVPFYEGDVGDRVLLQRILKELQIDAVIHFAGSIVVPESVAAPLDYYHNNTCKTRQLLQACTENSVSRFVFSSTAAVYGEPAHLPVSETAPTQPANPYGTSKLMIEWMLRDAAQAYDLRYAALRYFNVAGADPLGRAGQSTPQATHLIKVACEAAAGKRRRFQIFGDDYDTPDGTCVRDFIHVSDLAGAHVSALKHLEEGGDSLILNCGYGRGYSVREVLDALQRISGRPLEISVAPRRPGDVAALVADASRLRHMLEWQPEHDSIEIILKTALDWETGRAIRA